MRSCVQVCVCVCVYMLVRIYVCNLQLGFCFFCTKIFLGYLCISEQLYKCGMNGFRYQVLQSGARAKKKTLFPWLCWMWTLLMLALSIWLTTQLSHYSLFLAKYVRQVQIHSGIQENESSWLRGSSFHYIYGEILSYFLLNTVRASSTNSGSNFYDWMCTHPSFWTKAAKTTV